MFDFYTHQIEACDAEIERLYSLTRPDWPDPAPDDHDPLPPNQRKSHSKNLPQETPLSVSICGASPALTSLPWMG